MEWHTQDLEQVVGSVFSTMMAVDIGPSPLPCPDNDGLLTSAVYLSGPWNGAICLHCFPDLACRLAGCFLGLPASQALDDDVRDVMGEIANMIAGNLKCTMSPGVQLSTPLVAGGGEARSGNWTVRVFSSAFASGAGPFWLLMLTRPAN